ncbi:MAG: hypothetical protein JNN00_05125 [Chitinophagaceae bacterium]|nr:hypothetical protein [Chitinophagaceae bacterium]
MIAKTRILILTGFLLVLCQLTTGQTSFISLTDTARGLDSFKPPKNRELFHDYIDAGQKTILKSDGIIDSQFTPSANEEINFLLTKTVTDRIDWLQYSIEMDSAVSPQNKVRYLRGIENVLKYFSANTAARKVNPLLLPDIITTYENCMLFDKEGKSIESIIKNSSYPVALSIAKADRVTFEKNEGYWPSQYAVVLKYCALHPEQTFLTLKDNPDMPFADSLIRAVAKRYPKQLYDYAQASNRLGAAIRNIKDDIFISTVARMARSKSGQQYFPFLDNIVKGKLTIEQIDAIEADSIQYFKLLVKTQMDYVERLLDRDTAFAYKDLTAKIEKKAKDVFVNTINGLHNENDEVRFRCIQPLNAEELYYLAVLTDGLIYTSSYTKGVYPLMMKKINNRPDSLLMSLHFDHYRRFISQAAAYNTLGNFLTAFPNHTDADDLMRAFVSRLERTEGLEDGVDVADSYASIAETLKPRAAEMLRNVQANYERNVEENNPRGMAIYNILNKLFLSADSTQKIDLTKELGIPPVYNVPYSSLTNDSGAVVAQVFFYGDKDGQVIFPGFLNMFSGSNWKIDRSNPQWVVISSIKGKPVSIFANKPLPEETGEDDKAQKALVEYIETKKLSPTITIHRGHSYFANSTIEYMAPSSRIVFMGSCGGFHLIDAILKKSPDAHIIASKQIGKTAINKPFFSLLTEKLRNGNDIDWLGFWNSFKTAANVDGFEDYIPPYKNLGAIFIKAYTKAMGEEVDKTF